MNRGSNWLVKTTPAAILLALFELTRARLSLNHFSARKMVVAQRRSCGQLSPSQAALVEQVAYVIPRVAARMPWRADCLVQALAAKRWLGRHDVATTLSLGVPREKAIDFEAHAWLSAGENVVTGGDITSFQQISRL